MTTTHNQSQQTTPMIQASLFDLTEPPEDGAEAELDFDDLGTLLGYEEVPLLLVDTDPERAVARQKELMEFCFGGIGEEKKVEKRMGLAMQQLDIEQRHALRLLLLYQEPAGLAAHLKRCLADPAYGYGERGDQGRTIAQAMAALAEKGELDDVAAAWLETHREFQQRVLSGSPLSFRSLFDEADLDSFVPLLQRVGDMSWRLGVEGEGQYREFQGPLDKVWPEIGDTYVQWCEADNAAWLEGLKRKAARLPDTILRAARADRLRKQQERVEVDGHRVSLVTASDGTDKPGGSANWPRTMILTDAEGTGQLGLSRLSGHSFYELAWEGGLHVRRFEISGTTRQRIPFEHIELATLLAEALGAEYGLLPEAVTPAEVEAAYLRRMKAREAEVGPPDPSLQLPEAIQGQPAATYKVGDILVTMLVGGEDFAYVTAAGNNDQAVLLSRNEKREVMMAVPVRRGRPRRGSPLMTTPLAEVGDGVTWNRALCVWGAWLAWVTIADRSPA